MSVTEIKRSMKNMESINLDNIPDECYEAVKKIKTQMEEQFQHQKSKIENHPHENFFKVCTALLFGLCAGKLSLSGRCPAIPF